RARTGCGRSTARASASEHWAPRAKPAAGGAMVQERLPDRSIERFALEAPAEAVRGTQQAPHPDPVILRIAARVAGDDHAIAGPQRVAADTVSRELTGAAPLDAPAMHLAAFVGRHHVNPRMRVAEGELHELAFDRDLLALVVRRGERMVSARARR